MSGVTSIRRCAAAIAAASGGDFRREVSGGLQSGFDGGYLEQTGEARARLFHEDRETLRVDLAHAAQVNLEVTFANEFAEDELLKHRRVPRGEGLDSRDTIFEAGWDDEVAETE